MRRHGQLVAAVAGFVLTAALFALAIRPVSSARSAAAAQLTELTPDDSPGPLSRVHSKDPGPKGCSKCHDEHTSPSPARCLSCHVEIAERQKAGRGFHRDKKDGCADCHQEHRGENVDLKPLDQKSFDHTETGTVLEGRHAAVRICDKCHRPENSVRRVAGRSYLFKESGCRSCHLSPHPGRQDVCTSCHEPTSWRVTPWTVKKGRAK